jgi:hypothetical protein
MIVRVLGEGKFEIPAAEANFIETKEKDLEAALEAGNEEEFTKVLSELIHKIKSSGTELAPEDKGASELTIPHEGASIAEVKELLQEDVS